MSEYLEHEDIYPDVEANSSLMETPSFCRSVASVSSESSSPSCLSPDVGMRASEWLDDINAEAEAEADVIAKADEDEDEDEEAEPEAEVDDKRKD
jgi:hypothetical protein